MKIFILEDDINRINAFQKYLGNHSLTIVSEAMEAIKILEKDITFDLMFLDHDLGGQIYVDVNEENTGSTVAKYLSGKEFKGQIIIHSFNPIGVQNMINYLPNSLYIPFNIEFLKENFK